MEGFDLIALYYVDNAIVRGGDRIVISEFDYYRK
jgi:hypothetical protein